MVREALPLLMLFTIAAPELVAQADGQLSNLPYCGSGPRQVNEGTAGFAERFLDRVTERGSFSGIIWVSTGDSVLLHGAFGTTGSQPCETLDTTSIFPVGSLTKQFTATAILLLEAEGRLAVRDTVGAFLPDLPPSYRQLTLHELLTHTAQLPPDWPEGLPATPLYSREAALQAITGLGLSGTPGQYQYSNLGYTMLAAIIEEVSSQSYSAFLEARLFSPAGLTRTSVLQGTDPPALVTPKWDRYPAPPHDPNGGPWSTLGAGGILSTPADLVRWFEAVRGGAILDDHLTARLFLDHGDGYGYGWHLIHRADGSLSVIHHGGIGYGYKAVLRYYPESDMTMSIVTNLDIQDAGLHDDVLNSVLDFLRGDTIPLPAPSVARESPDERGWVFFSGADTVRIRFGASGWTVAPFGLRAALAVAGHGVESLPQAIETADRTTRLLTSPKECPFSPSPWVGPQFIGSEWVGALCAFEGNHGPPSMVTVTAVRPLSWSSNRSVAHARVTFRDHERWVSLLWEGEDLVEGWTAVGIESPATAAAVAVEGGNLEVFDWFRYDSVRIELEPGKDPARLNVGFLTLERVR